MECDNPDCYNGFVEYKPVIEDVATDLGAQIAELRDTVAALQQDIRGVRGWTEATVEVLNGRIDSCNKRIQKYRALESPASAPEPDPLCQNCKGCGIEESGSRWGDAVEVIGCHECQGTGRVTSQSAPATAHQEPPDEVLVCQCGHSKGHHHPYCHGNHEWMPSGCRCREFVPQAESIDAVNLLIRDINRFGELRFQFGMSLEHGDMENAEENRIAARELEVKIEAAIRAYGRDGAHG